MSKVTPVDRPRISSSRDTEGHKRRDSIGARVAKQAGLLYVSDASSGIRRVRHGKGFRYVLGQTRALHDPDQLKRIARLAIPPAYVDVWICRSARGHIQATGRDDRGRKQYRYHEKWRETRESGKYQRMLAFVEALPRLRRRLQRDLALPGLPRDKVLALVVSLLDQTRIRIGNIEYARDNSSFGLTTLRNSHVRFTDDGNLVLQFRGKGGALHDFTLGDQRLLSLVRQCHELPGQNLFQFVDVAGRTRRVTSDMVNDYLGAAMGDDFTAKDFRTWGATARALIILQATPLPLRPSQRALAGAINQAVVRVAQDLRNTPAVCKRSYINPQVFEAWRGGALHDAFERKLPDDTRRAERRILEFLQRYRRSRPRRHADR